MNWTTTTALNAFARRSDGRALLIYVSRGGDVGPWMIAAVESTLPGEDALRLPVTQVLQRVFDDHAHQIIEPEPTLAKALAKAEKYARWWRRSGATADACDCEDITPKAAE